MELWEEQAFRRNAERGRSEASTDQAAECRGSSQIKAFPTPVEVPDDIESVPVEDDWEPGE
jgi:hypothetical protein